MPGLARKVVVCAAVDGLVVQPLNSKKDARSPPPPVLIKYSNASISQIPRDSVPDIAKPNSFFEAFGIIGLITVFRYSYLVSITRRQQVAQIRGIPVYVVTDVALTPCSSQKDAGEAIARTSLSLCRYNDAHQGAPNDDDDDDESSSSDHDDGDGGEISGVDEGPDGGWSMAMSPNSSARSSIAEDVISRRGSYGRFAQRWFSRSGWAMGQKRTLGLSAEEAEEVLANTALPSKFNQAQQDAGETAAADAAKNLFPRFLRTAQILFGSSRSFFFSYDADITRSLNNPRVPAAPLVPLHNHVDSTFFWNQNIIRPFIDAGIDTLALPLIQGFVGQRTFVMDSQPPQVDDIGVKDSMEMSDLKSESSAPSSPPLQKATADMRPTEKRFDIIIISRRSVKRAGLRYLRRGVDEEGHVANFVESEQLLCPADAMSDPSAKVYSFTQIRGSVPLFFTQTPFSLKPAPVMQHSADTNFAALELHFDRLGQHYGGIQVVNLVEKHGIEAPLGESFQRNVQRLNEQAKAKAGEAEGGDKVPFEWFDFHAACRGMKFENVSLLLETLGSKLESFGSTLAVDDAVTKHQLGVLRTNCMDCLDRTNVCQSSFAKYMLEVQLKEQGFDMGAQLDQENSWFNTLWADNGDAISKQYASTSAMKGDFTRTRKRNYRGALTDAGLSVTRLFNGMFNDFFLQATIDFLLGNVTSLVFEEFEANMKTKDPAVSMQKMREQAIELCQRRVVADDSEEFIAGWTLLTPVTPDTIRGQPFEEAVLLVTDAALYLCRFDWNLDKVSSFERVDLAHLQKIQFGTYITSTMSPTQTDEIRNVGLVIEYKPGVTDITRVNTRSLSTSTTSAPATNDESAKGHKSRKSDSKAPSSPLTGFLSRRQPQPDPPRKIALKALYSQTSMASPPLRVGGNGRDGDSPARAPTARLTEIQQVVLIAAEIERLAVKNQPRLEGKKAGEAGLVEKADIISLADAKRNTGLLEQLGHSLKKLVWA